MNRRIYVLNVAGWYPENPNSNTGIFVKKHTTLISGFTPVITLSVHASSNTSIETNVANNNLREVRVFYQPARWRIWQQLQLVSAFFRGYYHIQKKYGAPSIIHLHVVFPAGVFVWLLLLIKRFPLLITEHWTGYMDADGRYEKLPALMKYITTKLMKKAIKISAVSTHLESILQRKFSVDKSKTIITGNVLQYEELRNKKQTIGPGRTSVKAMYLGSIDDHHKNIGMLMEAAQLVLKKSPAPFELHLYGDGPLLEHYRTVCNANDTLRNSIFFHGHVSNQILPDIYAEYDFFVMPSRYETFSIATAEAIINGLPVVCTKCGGPEEYVNNQNGWLSEPDAESFAAGILYMIQHYKQLDMLTARQKMLERYHIDNIKAQLKKLYQLSGNN